MLSYIFIPTKNVNLNEKNLLEIIEKKSALKCKADLKIGTLPRSFLFKNTCAYFEYIYESEVEYETIDGEIKTIKYIRKIPILVLRENLIAIGRCRYKYEQNLIKNFIKENLIKEYHIEQMTFSENFLRSFLERYPIYQCSIRPTKGNDPIDEITAKGKTDITNTQFFDDYFEEPLKSIKIHILELDLDVGVLFNKDGSIRIAQKLESEQILIVMKYIAENIIVHEIERTKLKKNIFGYVKNLEVK